MTRTVVRLESIVKRFPGVVANDHADLELAEGEVHALLGENGAGKTTLMSVLAGTYRPDSGTIVLDDRVVEWRSPGDAIDAGIGMVYQSFRLVQPFSVAENVLLGTPGGFLISKTDVEARVARLAENYGLRVDPAARVWQLSVGEQQRVEILKSLFRDARILVLDEHTAVLTPQEADRLFETLRRMAAEGRTVVFISHKLEEVMAVADRISVLRAGRRVATMPRSEATKSELARMMVGREVAFRHDRAERDAGDVCLRVDGIVADGDLGLPAVRGVSLELRAGEILGIAGVAGNGQRELTESIAGIRPLRSGTIEIAGRDATGLSAAERIRAGLAYVPEDRLGMGLVGSMDSVANVILKRVDVPEFRRGPFIDHKAAESEARALVEAFGVQQSSIAAPVRLMSGGNVQKLLLARELSSAPKVLIAAQPTAGLDVGATESVRAILLRQRAEGTGILLVSEDLDELLSLADRIAVMYEGEVAGTVAAGEAGPENIGLLMAGSAAGARG